MTKEFYLLGYWCNAYSRSSEKEYFWCGPFETRKEALEMGALKQNRGQPKTFYDWCKGRNRVFSSREHFVLNAKKIGMNPKFDD